MKLTKSEYNKVVRAAEIVAGIDRTFLDALLITHASKQTRMEFFDFMGQWAFTYVGLDAKQVHLIRSLALLFFAEAGKRGEL